MTISTLKTAYPAPLPRTIISALKFSFVLNPLESRSKRPMTCNKGHLCDFKKVLNNVNFLRNYFAPVILDPLRRSRGEAWACSSKCWIGAVYGVTNTAQEHLTAEDARALHHACGNSVLPDLNPGL